MKIIFRFATKSLLCLLSIALISRANAQGLRTLIISGGPDADYNQYAIESNARYVEKLTAKGPQRVLFADGKRTSRTISTLEPPANVREVTVLNWILDELSPEDKTVFKAPTLKRLDGDAQPKTILREVKNLAQNAKNGERALLYFTGHGSEGRRGGFFGFLGLPDYDNTLYNGWHGDVSMHQLAASLQNWPEKVPLTLVMVQCHNGGFANLIWQGGESSQDVWARDFCGFFATTGDRLAAGCTSEVDERNYQDFTTHFFAALSGISRDGRPVTGADYDKNGAVSGLEALAYTHLHDNSIDVPLCTSDFYLRQAFDEQTEKGASDWLKTPYSKVFQQANVWQQAILSGLSRDLKLSGESRLKAARTTQMTLKMRAARSVYGDYSAGMESINSPAVSRDFYAIEEELMRRFPKLKSRNARSLAGAKTKAIAFLKKRPAQVARLYQAATAYDNAGEGVEVREAKLLRFLRTAHTVLLQQRLQSSGTDAQKTVFARLRAAESRNFLKGA